METTNASAVRAGTDVLRDVGVSDVLAPVLLVQYSSGVKMQVLERSASVMIHRREPSFSK